MRRIAAILVLLFSATLCHASHCGFDGIGLSTESAGTNIELVLNSCIAPQNSTVTDCQIYVATAGTGPIACAVVDSDGTGGTPGTILCQGATLGSPAGNSWNTISLSGCPTLVGAHLYYIGRLNTDATTTNAYNSGDPGTQGYYFTQPCCTFISFIGQTLSRTGQQELSEYLDLVSADINLCGNTSVISDHGGSQGTVYATGAQCTPKVTTGVSTCQIHSGGSAGSIGCGVYDTEWWWR
jgi:hypothetical protein